MGRVSWILRAVGCRGSSIPVRIYDNGARNKGSGHKRSHWISVRIQWADSWLSPSFVPLLWYSDGVRATIRVSPHLPCNHLFILSTYRQSFAETFEIVFAQICSSLTKTKLNENKYIRTRLVISWSSLRWENEIKLYLDEW